MRRTLPLLLLAATACTTSHAPGATSAPTTAAVTPPAATTPAATTGAPSAAASCRPAPAGPSDTGPESNAPGDIPDNTQFVAYSPPSHRYSVKVPEGWARTASGDTVTFTDKFNAVRVELVPAAHAPTVASAKTDEVPRLAAATPCFALRGVTTATRRGAGAAVLVTYRADAAPDAVTGKVVRDDVERYEFWRNGVEAVLTLSGAQGADNVDPWRTVSDSFTWG